MAEGRVLVLVTGSRAYPDRWQVERILHSICEQAQVDFLHGGAAGVDSWADAVAKELGTGSVCCKSANPATYLEFPEHVAEAMKQRLSSLPPRAWPLIRNTQLVRLAVRRAFARVGPNGVYGFWNRVSAGTLDCLDKAVEAGLHTRLFVPGTLEVVHEWHGSRERIEAWCLADRKNPLQWEHFRSSVRQELIDLGIAAAA